MAVVEITDIFAASTLAVVLPTAASPAHGAAPSASTTAGDVPLSEGFVKDSLKVAQYFDQGCKSKEVRPVAPEAIDEMRARWEDTNGTEPVAELQYTDNQLSVLFRLNVAGHNMLAFDMGVWGPFGARRERLFSMTAYVQNADGTYIARELPGAQCYEDWEAAWDFATVGFVMGNHVDRGTADAYKTFFKKMALYYPACWWLAYQAEWQLRHEWASQEKRRQQAFHVTNPGLSLYDPLRPWNSILKAAIRGVDSISYWDENFKEKARKFERDRATVGNQWIARQASNFLAGQEDGSQAGVPPPPQTPAGWGKRALKRARASAAATTGGAQQAQQPQQVRQRTEEAQRPEWADKKRPDGRWLYDYNGVELCYGFGRTANGCGVTCTADPKRSHACEWCRGQHRSIRCPSKPNWTPPPKGKGKGKGKGKDL